MNLLDLDKRWQRFNDPTRTCPCCGQHSDGIFDIGFDHPDVWSHASPRDSDTREISVGEDRLNGDLCRFGALRYLRCVLPLKIRGSDQTFFFAPWAQVQPADFYAYLDEVSGDGARFTRCSGSLANTLHGLDLPGDIACDLVATEARERPRLVAARDTALAGLQANGVSFDTLLDIYGAAGHDIRAHLLAD